MSASKATAARLSQALFSAKPAPVDCNQLVRRLRHALAGRCDQGYLFGSWGRGEPTVHSDVDLLIVAESQRAPVERFKDFIDLAIDFAPIDLVVYSPVEFRALLKHPNALVRHARRDWRALLPEPSDGKRFPQ